MMKTRVWVRAAQCAASILVMGLSLSTQAQESAAVTVPATRCAQLQAFQWPDLAVDEVRVVPAGQMGTSAEAAAGPASDTRIPEHCLFRATIAKRTGEAGQQLGIGIDLRLPLEWNGRFAFEGGGGLDGIQRLYAAFPYDAGIADPAFYRMHFGTSPTGEMNSADATLGFGSLRYLSMTPPNPAFDPMTLDFDRDPQRLLETAKINDADSVFLNTFAKHGKLILYHGMSDQGLSPLDTADWYDRLAAANGPNVPDWARLFLIPGMTHCAGGSATDQFDMLTAIQNWVEEGRPPERIIARGKSFPNLTRPLCPHPTVARYVGGDPSRQGSFVCKK